MKFLVIRFSSIGDIVLASPVLRCLKQQVITSEVHFLTRESFKAVTAANPYVDRFHYYNNDVDAVVEKLRAEQYDYVIDLQDNFRSGKIRRALGVPSRTIDKLNVRKLLLTKFRINIMPGKHITYRSMDTVADFGVTYDGKGLDYFISPEDQVKEEDIPAAHHAGYIALVIGASYHTKKLPVHQLQKLCSAIDHPVILIGGPEDMDAGAQIASVDPVKIYNSCGRFRLGESADLIRKAKLVISHDTGMQYIACAFGKPVIALWGSTSPKLDVEPFYADDLLQRDPLIYENVIRRPALRCQPCSKYGNKKCPLGHFKCMEEMDILYIVRQAMVRLGRK